MMILTSCSSGGKDLESTLEKPRLLQSSIANNEIDVPSGANVLELQFDQNIVLDNQKRITLNNEPIQDVQAAFKSIRLSLSLEKGKSYVVQIPESMVKGPTGVFADAIVLNFKTIIDNQKTISKSLVVKNPTKEVTNVYNFLYENYQKKTVAGSMANVNWNLNEANWVFKHSSKYPALNCFDFLHLYASPTSWINYENIDVIKDWWNRNGLVASMWHWNVPVSKNSTNQYAFYTKETDFDISKAVIAGSWEHSVLKEDLSKIADHLLLLKENNIPVIWRPLHEASGKWFWWGAKDESSYKKLWVWMYDYVQERGVNNLIWVWTSEGADYNWYPGDAYVDIIGCDLYNKTTADQVLDVYSKLNKLFPNKMLALSEFGNIATYSDQQSKDINWSWIMPWYDYDHTKDPTSGAFDSKDHGHATISYWQNLLNNANVITLDKMPSLK